MQPVERLVVVSGRSGEAKTWLQDRVGIIPLLEKSLAVVHLIWLAVAHHGAPLLSPPGAPLLFCRGALLLKKYAQSVKIGNMDLTRYCSILFLRFFSKFRSSIHLGMFSVTGSSACG
jgi:hypothetical protein